jgi:hypothetical protein
MYSKASLKADARSDRWFDRIRQIIAASEYDIRYDASLGVWSSPNRAQNLRFYYDETGFSAQPRQGNPSWSVAMHLKFFGRTVTNPMDGGSFAAYGNSARSRLNDLTITYENQPDGMRQNFEVDQRLRGNGDLRILMEIESALSPVIDPGSSGVTFVDPTGNARFRYTDLLVTDAVDRQLPASMAHEGHYLEISIDDRDAVYPLLIDPLSTTPDWFREGHQLNEFFGYRLAPAGDVNGDGYSDIMVAATHYDNDQVNEGRVFVFHGGATGPDTTADWVTEGNQDEAYYGTSLAAAGDVNGDGYGDVIAGSSYFDHGQHDEGMAMVYFGGPGGLSDTANWVGESDQSDAMYASAVACAGDVNGDGYSDLLVGSVYFQNGQYHEGRAFAYYGSPTGPSPTADWITECDQANAGLGSNVASAGDVNGDGYSDVMVAATTFTNGESSEGVVFVYHGGPSGLAPAYAWFGQGDQANAYYGTGVSSAGDVNGDGYADIVVGAPNYDNSAVDCGLAFVYHGSAAGLSGSWDWVVDPYQGSSYLGSVVACAGDVNGDGYADVLVTAPYYDNGHIDEGAAFLFLGSSTGLRNTPWSFQPDWQSDGNADNAIYGYAASSAGDVNGDGFSDLLVGGLFYDAGYGRAFVFHGGMSGPSVLTSWGAEGNQTASLFAHSVATAGDVNGDGYWDVIIGAPTFDNGQADEGRAFVFHGGEDGLSMVPDWMTESDQAGAGYGCSVSCAGDVNADGYTDVIVGADGYDNGQSNEGVAFVFHGSASGLSPTVDWTSEADQTGASLGYCVAQAGDVNGDGYSDVLVAAPLYDHGEDDEGRVLIFHGSPSGLLPAPSWTDESNQAGSGFGRSVASAGDVNGDGYSDIVIGAPHFDGGQLDEGRVFAYYGGMTGLSPVADWQAESNQIMASFGASVCSAGDVNGDGYSDVIVGAPQYDNGQFNEGRAFVYYGAAGGLASTPGWTVEVHQTGAYAGQSVSGAGDVNGDGYSDVVVGVPHYTSGEANEGSAQLYCGGAAGPSLSPDWSAESNQPDAMLGNCIASAGDVNGDGYSDLIVGCSYYDDEEADEGGAFVYFGNAADGMATRPRQYRADLVTPIAPLGRTYSNTQASLGLTVRPFGGPMKARVQFEVEPIGVPFTGTGLVETPWTFTGTGHEFKQSLDGLAVKTNHRWRARITYSLVQGSVQHHSRWYYPEGNGGLGEADFRSTNIASEPTAHASALNLSQQSASGQHTLVATWSSGDGSNRIVIASETEPIAGCPRDGLSYLADTVFGHGSEVAPGEFVVYKGTGNSVTLTGLTIRRTYHVAVYEFNGSAGDENYLVAGGITNVGSLTLLNQPPQVLSAIPDTIVNEDFGTVFIRNLNAVFADDTTLAFGALPLAGGLVPSIVNDSLFVTAEPDFAGVVGVRASAFDGELTAADTFLVTVLGENDPPGVSNFTVPADQSRFVTNPTSTTPIEFSWNRSTDPDGQTVRYVVWTDTSLSFDLRLAPYEGTDTTFSLEIRQLDTLAMGLGAAQGDSIELFWRVLSISGLDSVPNSIPLQIRVVREIIVEVGDADSKVPMRFALHQNYPNPFNASTTIKYDLARTARVSIKMYNLLGQEVRTLVRRVETAGYKVVVWDGRDDTGRSVATGLYLCRFEAGNAVHTRKVLLLK